MDSNAEFFEATKHLIEDWCDRRSLRPLASLLPAYLAFNGMTDGWGELLNALKNVRASSQSKITDSELDTLNDLIRAAEAAIHRRG